MGIIKDVLPVKLIFSVFTSNEDLFLKALHFIEDVFGKAEIISDKLDFNHTQYYKNEFGDNLFRKFIVIKSLFHRENLSQCKIVSNNIEKEFLENNKRKVNIDPGYISLENFILFTTKNYTHRIYLEKGIFADLTLIFQNKEFQSLSWTYPDYSSDEIRNFLKDIRTLYKEQLKNEEEIKNAKKMSNIDTFLFS